MLVDGGAVLNDLIFGATHTLLLPGHVAVRVGGAHLAIGQFVVVDGGHTLVGQELTSRTSKATGLSLVRLVFPFNTDLAFQCFVFVRKSSCLAWKAGGVGRSFGAVVAVYRAWFTLGTCTLLRHVGIPTRFALGTKRLATRNLIPSSLTNVATGFFGCSNCFAKFSSFAKILDAFGTPSTWFTFDLGSTVAQVPFFALGAVVSCFVDVFRNVATEDTIAYVGVVFGKRT